MAMMIPVYGGPGNGGMRLRFEVPFNALAQGFGQQQQGGPGMGGLAGLGRRKRDAGMEEEAKGKKSHSCQCLDIDLHQLLGPWVQVGLPRLASPPSPTQRCPRLQIYGNPESLSTIYTALAEVDSVKGGPASLPIQPSCVGMSGSPPFLLLRSAPCSSLSAHRWGLLK